MLFFSDGAFGGRLLVLICESYLHGGGVVLALHLKAFAALLFFLLDDLVISLFILFLFIGFVCLCLACGLHALQPKLFFDHSQLYLRTFLQLRSRASTG